MFSYVGLTKDQCVWLQKERSLYLLKSSRISMCGVTPSNIDYVAESIFDAVTKAEEYIFQTLNLLYIICTFKMNYGMKH